MNFHNHALVLDVVERLQSHGSKVGKTHVQKALFLAQMAKASEVSIIEPFKFVLYKHGPYSFSLDDVINEMFVYDALVGQPMSGYGTALGPGSNSAFLHNHNEAALTGEEISAHERVCKFIGTSDVRILERWATVAWIRRVENATESEVVAERLNKLKPHISVEEALEANNTVIKLLNSETSPPIAAKISG